MARIRLHFLDHQFCYTTQLAVRITDINGARHLGNDSMISTISEARARFLFDFGVEESADEQIIVTDLATTYLAEVYASKLANDIAKQENDDALEAVRKSGKSQILSPVPAERVEWKKVMVKTHREMEAKIGPGPVQDFYKETGFDPAR